MFWESFSEWLGENRSAPRWAAAWALKTWQGQLVVGVLLERPLNTDLFLSDICFSHFYHLLTFWPQKVLCPSPYFFVANGRRLWLTRFEPPSLIKSLDLSWGLQPQGKQWADTSWRMLEMSAFKTHLLGETSTLSKKMLVSCSKAWLWVKTP